MLGRYWIFEVGEILLIWETNPLASGEASQAEYLDGLWRYESTHQEPRKDPIPYTCSRYDSIECKDLTATKSNLPKRF